VGLAGEVVRRGRWVRVGDGVTHMKEDGRGRAEEEDGRGCLHEEDAGVAHARTKKGSRDQSRA
jgi:hypothetical protein